jgi:hypothetical protein
MFEETLKLKAVLQNVVRRGTASNCIQKFFDGWKNRCSGGKLFRMVGQESIMPLLLLVIFQLILPSTLAL